MNDKQIAIGVTSVRIHIDSAIDSLQRAADVAAQFGRAEISQQLDAQKSNLRAVLATVDDDLRNLKDAR